MEDMRKEEGKREREQERNTQEEACVSPAILRAIRRPKPRRRKERQREGERDGDGFQMFFSIQSSALSMTRWRSVDVSKPRFLYIPAVARASENLRETKEEDAGEEEKIHEGGTKRE